MILKFELLILILVRSFRELNFRLYTAVLTAITPWMFALDRTIMFDGYLSKQTSTRTLTVQKTTNAFSSIPLDHAHEQNNELIEREGWGY